jgi:DNA-binding PadR family transcriptional regulator
LESKVIEQGKWIMPKRKVNVGQQGQEIKAKSITPTEEAILMVLFRYRDEGIYNLHVLDEINEVNQRYGRKEVSPGTFYPTVKRLEVEGLVEGSWKEEVVAGVPRRYLKITASGIKALILNRNYRFELNQGMLQDGNKTLSESAISKPSVLNLKQLLSGLPALSFEKYSIN